MKLRPLGDRIVVRRQEIKERTGGGIYLPDQAKERPARGTVQATGSAVTSVVPGVSVIFGKFAGTEVELAGEKLVILGEADLLGTLEEGEEQKPDVLEAARQVTMARGAIAELAEAITEIAAADRYLEKAYEALGSPDVSPSAARV